MRWPARSFGLFTLRVSTAMKPCRNTREGNAGNATNGHSPFPAAKRDTNSELDISEASNSSLPAMRSNSSRGLSIGMKFRSIPAGLTSPMASESMRS
jgi:hypothetical protein